MANVAKPKESGRTWAVVVPATNKALVDSYANNTSIRWVRGQLERSDAGFEHYQLVASTTKQMVVNTARRVFGVRTVERVIDGDSLAKYVTKESDSLGEPVKIGQIPKTHTMYTSFLEYGLAQDASHSRDRLKKANDDDASLLGGDDDTRSSAGGVGEEKRKTFNERWEEACLEAIELENIDAAIEYMEHKFGVYKVQERYTTLWALFIRKMCSPNVARYKATDFNVPLLDMTSELTVVIIGTTGLGKTQYAKAHFDNFVHVREKNDYERILPSTECLIVDDVDSQDWKPMTFLRLIDVENDVTMNVKYSSRRIPAQLPRFILANHFKLLIPAKAMDVTIDAMLRRCRFYEAYKPLFGKRDLGEPVGLRHIPHEVVKEIYRVYSSSDSQNVAYNYVEHIPKPYPTLLDMRDHFVCRGKKRTVDAVEELTTATATALKEDQRKLDDEDARIRTWMEKVERRRATAAALPNGPRLAKWALE